MIHSNSWIGHFKLFFYVKLRQELKVLLPVSGKNCISLLRGNNNNISHLYSLQFHRVSILHSNIHMLSITAISPVTLSAGRRRDFNITFYLSHIHDEISTILLLLLLLWFMRVSSHNNNTAVMRLLVWPGQRWCDVRPSLYCLCCCLVIIPLMAVK